MAKGLIPEKVQQRTDKIGFSTPEDLWFRKVSFKNTIENIVDSESFRGRHYFNAKIVQSLIQAHMRGEQDTSITIWRIVNVELWLRRFID